MIQIIIFILIGFAGVWLGRFLGRKKRMKDAGSLEIANQVREENKEKAKDKILELLRERGRISNDDVEKLIGVADSMATNYLDELEKEGKIIKHGESGRGVYYTQK